MDNHTALLYSVTIRPTWAPSQSGPRYFSELPWGRLQFSFIYLFYLKFISSTKLPGSFTPSDHPAPLPTARSVRWNLKSSNQRNQRHPPRKFWNLTPQVVSIYATPYLHRQSCPWRWAPLVLFAFVAVAAGPTPICFSLSVKKTLSTKYSQTPSSSLLN